MAQFVKKDAEKNQAGEKHGMECRQCALFFPGGKSSPQEQEKEAEVEPEPCLAEDPDLYGPVHVRESDVRRIDVRETGAEVRRCARVGSKVWWVWWVWWGGGIFVCGLPPKRGNGGGNQNGGVQGVAKSPGCGIRAGMQIHVSPRHVTLTASIHQHVAGMLSQLEEIAQILAAHVVLVHDDASKPEDRFTAKVHLALNGSDIVGEGRAETLHAALDLVSAKLGRQLRKRKTNRIDKTRQKVQRAVQRRRSA